MNNLQRSKVRNKQSEDHMDILKRNYNLDNNEANAILKSMGSNFLVYKFAKNHLRIKGLGFTKTEIIQLVSYLGEESNNLSIWAKIAPLSKSLGGDSERAIYAYKAGLTSHQLDNMNENEKGLDRLKVLAKIKSI